MAKPKSSLVTKSLPIARGTYLASLRVEHVRCFGEEQLLELRGPDRKPRRWTIILGENGVGKTTLLQLAALSTGKVPFDPYWFDYPDYDEGPRRPLSFHRSSRVGGQVNAEFIQRGELTKRAFKIGEHDVGPGVEPIDDQLCICAYGASRRLSQGRFSRRRSPRLRLASLFIDAPLRNAEEWLLETDYAAAKEGQANGSAATRLGRIKGLLTDLLPDVSDVRVGENKQWGPTVEFETPYGWVPLDGLSLGYQSLVAWMVDFAAEMFVRHERTENPLAQPAVVLVDEIDLHLHPKWQRQVMQFLSKRFPGTQFIATAHSPLVVQAAGEANVVLLKRQGDRVVIRASPNDVRNWRVDQILTSDLYGLPTARAPELDGLIKRRRELLTQARLTTADQRELRAVEKDIGDLPAGESPAEQEAISLILRASNELTSEKRRQKK